MSLASSILSTCSTLPLPNCRPEVRTRVCLLLSLSPLAVPLGVLPAREATPSALPPGLTIRLLPWGLMVLGPCDGHSSSVIWTSQASLPF